MPENLKTAPPSLVRETWNALQSRRKTYPILVKALADAGYHPPSRSSFFEWRKEWLNPPPPPPPEKDPAPDPLAPKLDTASPTPPPPPKPSPKAILPPQVTPLSDAAKKVVERLSHEPIAATIADIERLPPDLVDALGLRMLIVAKGTGLDRVEAAIVKAATAISNKAEAIADQLLLVDEESENVSKDGETVTSKTKRVQAAGMRAIDALGKLAEAMHRITSSRMLFSVSYRNFGEADRLSGEGYKFRAEGMTIENAARADSAREITGTTTSGDAEFDDDAIEAIRDIEAEK